MVKFQRHDGADAPVESLSEDRLGRRFFAEALAAEVMAAPVARGYVMGLTGAWGTGKTSILNMAVDALGDKAITVHFNPWMFSGTEGPSSARSSWRLASNSVSETQNSR